jgi:hypothetical protein
VVRIANGAFLRPLGLAAALSAIMVFITPGMATAASGYMYVGPANSYGYYSQNDASNSLRLLSSATDMASGKCVDIWYDWNRDGGDHYDARVARSCRDFFSKDSGTNIESTGVAGANKRFACYGNNNATTGGTCNVAVGSPSTVNPNLPNTCTRAWWVTSTGTAMYGSGGSPTSCNS